MVARGDHAVPRRQPGTPGSGGTDGVIIRRRRRGSGWRCTEPGEVRRYDGVGHLDRVVAVPRPQTTSVQLSGADRRDLLITTAREGYDAARSTREPLAGRLFTARAEHPGLPYQFVECRGREVEPS
nr:SMP-30/gluconolactonase/LRE family protein [Pseudonocardia hierapolitana]